MTPLNILFIGGGKRYSAAECFIEAGRKYGYHIQIFAYEMGFGLPIEKIATVIQGLKFSDPDILNDIADVIQKHSIKIAIPYHDHAVELLAQLQDLVFTPVSDAKICNTFLAKLRQTNFSLKLGYQLPGLAEKSPQLQNLIEVLRAKVLFFSRNINLN